VALVTRFGTIDQMPAEIRDAFESELDRLRQIYLEPDVRDDYRIDFERCDVEGVVHFLCDEHAFARDRVIAALQRAFGSSKLF